MVAKFTAELEVINPEYDVHGKNASVQW
jgi:hypothetical protein